MTTSTTPQAHRDRETTPDIALSVLGYHQDEEWVALVLEMDLRGFGATFEEALDTSYQATGLPIPPAHVIAGLRSDYSQADG